MTAQCLITGCLFVDPYLGKSIRGDLHKFGASYIFNASGCEWEYTPPEPVASLRQIACTNYFEKNKVIVFAVTEGVFNEAAFRYLEILK